jgi:RNase adapter protein RapZ
VTRTAEPTATAPPSGAAAESPARTDQSVVILTGLSGAGKSQASKVLEDAGYGVVDNLPAPLLESFLELRRNEPARYRRAALVLDIRSGDPATAIRRARVALEREGTPLTVIYLEASDAVLVSRFSETRHRHPLEERNGVQVSIGEERRRLERTRDLADEVIDTSGMSIARLRERLHAVAPTPPGADALSIELVTFGFKHGIPLEADLVFDLRFLANPYWQADLKPLSGLDAAVRDYVLRQPVAARFLDLVAELVELVAPAFRAEGKRRLTVAVGCTGGRHRSIAVAEELARRLDGLEDASVTVTHRELRG